MVPVGLVGSRDTSPRAAVLEALWERGRQAWPNLALTREAFVSWADARLAAEADVERLVAEDLFLVAACLHGVPGAMRAFVEGPLAKVEQAITRILPDPARRADLMQDLAIHLVAPDEGGEDDVRLARYDGRAPLRPWLRVMAVRRATSKVRNKSRETDLEEATLDAASAADPELSVLRRIHREDIRAIFRDAIAEVAPEDQTLLQLHYVQGSTLNELAVIRRTSRSSLHRHFESVRDALFTRIHKLVRERMHLGKSQHASMLRIFRSDLKDALGDLLRER